METVHLRLSELNNKIQGVIQNAFGYVNFWVVADITNHSFKAQKNYHHFELIEKDPDSNDIIARISGKAWGKGALSILEFERATGQQFTNNIHVLVNVSVSFHPVYGLQVGINDIDTSYTLGILEKQKQATLLRLVTENPSFIKKTGDRYITRNNQLELSIVIQKIAVITSGNSAGGEDFKHTLLHNTQGYQFYIDFYYTEVQGEMNAEQFLGKLIEVYHSKNPYDVVVITRGGGAQTDFLIFDNYSIGRAVAKFPIPVITGIGHQKNETITDLMAHTQTKTPTKAAEFIIAHNKLFEEKLLNYQKVILIKTQQVFSIHFQSLSSYMSTVVNKSRDLISNYKDSLVQINQVTINTSKSILFKHKTSLMSMASELTTNPKMLLNNLVRDLDNTMGNLSTFNGQFIKNQQASLGHYISVMKLMSPGNLLKKGFAIIKVKGVITGNPEHIKAGEDIDILFSDIQINATVRKKNKYDGTDFNV